MENDFWVYVERLIAASSWVIDRPKGSTHPSYADMVYPVDYGYLLGTRSMDGAGIDVWVGSQDTKMAKGLVCTVDLKKRDAEIKILIGCTDHETQEILAFLNDHDMRVLYVNRE
jgi:inorganic pyrophosphatase